MIKQARITVKGKVQGVFYRAHALDQAEMRHLTGYAKNMPNGSVEILVQGDQLQIEEFLKWCQKGSPLCRIENIGVMWEPMEEKATEFSCY